MSEFSHHMPDQAVRFRNPFTLAKEKLKGSRKDKDTSNTSLTHTEPNMPWTVGYALQYKEGKLGSHEISSLIHNNLTDLASYSILKALNPQPEQQSKFLESFVDTVVENPQNPTALIPLQEETLTRVLGSEMTPIAGAKASQIIRQGVNLWGEKFTELAKSINEGNADTVPVYIAYAGTLGLRQGIEEFAKTQRKMMVLIPDWIKDEQNQHSGYEIDFGREKGERVHFTQKDFQRPEQFVFVDDTRRNGVQAQVMWDYWTKNSGEPLSEDHVRVVNFAPKTDRI